MKKEVQSKNSLLNSFICSFPNCGKRYARKGRLLAHSAIHEEQKPFRCEVEGCKAAYSWKHSLVRHNETRHLKSNAGQFKCTKEGCLATFKTKFTLKQHSNRKHFVAPKKEFICDLCPDKFTKEWQLLEHAVSHDPNKRPFSCENCGENFSIYGLYKQHKLSHQPNIELEVPEKLELVKECKHCEEKFRTYRELRRHRKIVHPPEYRCYKCNQKFTRPGCLKSHELTHSNSIPKPVFICSHNDCKKYYTHKRNLMVHIRTVHNKELFNCELCDKKLVSKQRLKLHLNTKHTLQEPKLRKPKLPKNTAVVNSFSGITDQGNLYRFTKPGPKCK